VCYLALVEGDGRDFGAREAVDVPRGPADAAPAVENVVTGGDRKLA